MTDIDFYFPLFEDLLHGRLNPMLGENADGYDYHIRMAEMIHYRQHDTGAFGIDFHRPFNLKTRYYEQVLLGELNAYVADMLDIISKEQNSKIRAYLRDQILDKHLSLCLKKLGEKIRKEGLWLTELKNAGTNSNRSSDIWIFHFLKICIAKAYLEVQETLQDVVPFRQTEEWLYSTHAGEPLPVESWIKKRKAGKPATKKEISQNSPLPETGFHTVGYYTGNQVRELLGISEATLGRRIKQPGFPKPVKHGRDNYYLKKDIDPLIKNQ